MENKLNLSDNCVRYNNQLCNKLSEHALIDFFATWVQWNKHNTL